MNAEELKMILEALQSLGANSKDAFIWWLVLKYGSGLLTALMMLCAAIGIPALILRAVGRSSSRAKALEGIAEIVGVDFKAWREYEFAGQRPEDVANAVRDRLKA